MLCTATDVGIYGLLASQSCYHSMLAPCWFTLWTSNRFLYPYIFLISLEIFLFSFYRVVGMIRKDYQWLLKKKWECLLWQSYQFDLIGIGLSSVHCIIIYYITQCCYVICYNYLVVVIKDIKCGRDGHCWAFEPGLKFTWPCSLFLFIYYLVVSIC